MSSSKNLFILRALSHTRNYLSDHCLAFEKIGIRVTKIGSNCWFSVEKLVKLLSIPIDFTKP